MEKKSKVLLIVVFSMAVNFAFAQIELGLIGGINSTTNKIEPSEGFDTSSRIEYGIGLLANLPISEEISIQVQPMFIKKGTDIKVTGFDDEISVSASYFEIPIFGKYSFESGKVTPYVLAGPSIGFLLSAEQTASFIPSDQEDIKEDSKSIDFSLGLGAGAKIDIGNPSLYFQVTYVTGLTNIDDDSSENDFTESIKSRGLTLMAGISFPISNLSKKD